VPAMLANAHDLALARSVLGRLDEFSVAFLCEGAALAFRAALIVVFALAVIGDAQGVRAGCAGPEVVIHCAQILFRLLGSGKPLALLHGIEFAHRCLASRTGARRIAQALTPPELEQIEEKKRHREQQRAAQPEAMATVKQSIDGAISALVPPLRERARFDHRFANRQREVARIHANDQGGPRRPLRQRQAGATDGDRHDVIDEQPIPAVPMQGLRPAELSRHDMEEKMSAREFRDEDDEGEQGEEDQHAHRVLGRWRDDGRCVRFDR